MSENVVGLRGQPVVSSRRREFAEAVAGSFDKYVEDYGCEPEAVVYVLGGLKQSARVGWHVTGDSEGGPTAMQAFAAVALLNEARS